MMNIKNYFKKNMAAINLGFMAMNPSSPITTEAIAAYREEQKRNALAEKSDANYKHQAVIA